jgi:apolipoprotein N-acyltransferase
VTDPEAVAAPEATTTPAATAPAATAPAAMTAPGGGSPAAPRLRRGTAALPAIGAGLLIALSVPPAGIWPLGIVGLAILGALLRGRRCRTRALIGFLAGMGLYGVTIYWFTEFNFAGGVASMAAEATFLMVAAMLTPPGRGRWPAWVGALVLQDWVRTYIPFGGVPLGGIPLGQAAGPLAPAARIGGQLLVTGVAGAIGVGVEAMALEAWRRGRGRGQAGVRGAVGWAAVVFPITAVIIAAAGVVAPGGRQGAAVRVALVQGGGRRGLRAIENPPQQVYDRQVQASAAIPGPVDLIVWPEDVIALDGPIAASPVAAQVGAIARANHAPLLAGVTEDVGATHFRNAEVVWNSAGRITGRYDKVHRVPFGEYIPLRSIVRHFVSLTFVPRDAIAGHGTGEVATGAGPVAVVISFEIFFPARARSGVSAGGQILLAPTNTASYRDTQVVTAEIAAARLRAWETGRDVAMVAPTGYSDVITSRGRLVARTRLSAQTVLEETIHRRTGRTPYVLWGDLPAVAAAALLLAGGWIAARAARDHT